MKLADSKSRRDFLQWTGLIKVAWEKLKICLKFNVGEKGISVII